jgi:hypothetical protein
VDNHKNFKVLASSAVDREFKPRSGETKDYEIGICCFSAKHAALRRKSKDWLVRIVFGFTRPGLELTIYRTRGEHANHYVTYAFDHAMRESQQTTYRDKKGS